MRSNFQAHEVHVHSNAASPSEGSPQLGAMTYEDFTDAAAPAAPAAGRTRTYAVSGKPRFRPSGGADIPLVYGGSAWRTLYFDSTGEPVLPAIGSFDAYIYSSGASAAPYWNIPWSGVFMAMGM